MNPYKVPFSGFKLKGETMAKLIINAQTKGVENMDQEIMATICKVLVIYNKEGKTCYFTKWKPFFHALFPSEMQQSKKGMWLPTLANALKYLVDNNIIGLTKKTFKNGEGNLYAIRADQEENVINILDSFGREYDDQLMEEIMTFFNENEQSGGGFKSQSVSFDQMGFNN